MEISGSAFLAVFAVSGSVAFLAMKVNEHLLSDFINKLEIEIYKDQAKKKVMFSNKVVELGSHNKDIRFDDYISMKNYDAESSISSSDESLKSMPLNWQVLYKGILNDKITLRGYD